MSSTNRGRSRNISDYYITPEEEINKFLDKFLGEHSFERHCRILDPCAGGDSIHPMAYPNALEKHGFTNITTIDIRPDSRALIQEDYLHYQIIGHYDLIITNPPFHIAEEVVRKAFKDIAKNGTIIMLLRLNFMGSQNRKGFWLEFPPDEIYIHSKRMCFTGDGKIDSIEYAHFVWHQEKMNESDKKTRIVWL